MNLDERRERLVELCEMESRLLSCLEDVRAARQRADIELQEAARADLDLRSAPRIVAAPKKSRTVKLSDAREAAVRLHSFVASELAVELDCSPRQARVLMAQLTDVVHTEGILAGEPYYRCVIPAGLSEDRPCSVTAGDLAASRGQQVTQSLVGMVACADLRPVVSEALRQGWRLVHRKGAKHPLRLVRDGREPIGLPSTPRNPGAAAKRLRDQLA
jgi:hypothetical protein